MILLACSCQASNGVIESYPYMLTILDVPEALNRRRYPSGMTATLRFAVEVNFLVENDGGYQLTVADGRANCAPADHGHRTFTPAGQRFFTRVRGRAPTCGWLDTSTEAI